MGDHGRVIPLGQKESNRHVELYASHYDPDLTVGVHTPEFLAYGAAKGTVRLISYRRAKLAGLPARAYITRFRDKDTHASITQETWLAVRKQRIQYLFNLTSPSSTYAKDRRVFLRIISTVRLTKGEYTG